MHTKLKPLGTIYTKEDILNAFIKGSENKKDFETFFEESYCSEKQILDEDVESEINNICDSDYIPELQMIFKDENIKNKMMDVFKNFLINFEIKRKSLNFKNKT